MSNSEGNPRQRTLKRLGCLTGVAAAGAVVGGYLLSSRPREEGGVAGYMVVDMLPPPARCLGLAAAVHAMADWRGPDTIVVTFATPSMPDAVYANLPPGGSAALSSWDIKPDHAEVTLKVDESTELVEFSLLVTCGGVGQEQLRTKVAIGKRLAPATVGKKTKLSPPSLTVTLSDSR